MASLQVTDLSTVFYLVDKYIATPLQTELKYLLLQAPARG